VAALSTAVARSGRRRFVSVIAAGRGRMSVRGRRPLLRGTLIVDIDQPCIVPSVRSSAAIPCRISQYNTAAATRFDRSNLPELLDNGQSEPPQFAVIGCETGQGRACYAELPNCC
jgi:hypothetical protein